MGPVRNGDFPLPKKAQMWRRCLLAKPSVREGFPFGPSVAVYYVGKKVFALLFVREGRICLNLKGVPEWSESLRMSYPEILPTYHMNQRHWNTLQVDGRLSKSLVANLIDLSYDLVSATLKGRKHALPDGAKALPSSSKYF